MAQDHTQTMNLTIKQAVNLWGVSTSTASKRLSAYSFTEEVIQTRKNRRWYSSAVRVFAVPTSLFV